MGSKIDMIGESEKILTFGVHLNKALVPKNFAKFFRFPVTSNLQIHA
jgi:hypothetical protein